MITGVTVSVLGAILIGFTLTKSDKTEGWYTTASISKDGVLINEVIDNDFGNGRNRGIWRDIPDLSLDDIIDVSTPTADGTVTYLDERSESRFNLGCLSEGTACIRIGDPDILWRGLHRYELTYKLPLDDFIGSGKCGRGMVEVFCWNAVPERWAYEITKVTAEISNANWLENPQCLVGDKSPEDGADCAIEQVGEYIVAVSLDHPPETPLIITAEVKRSRQLANTFSDTFFMEPPPVPTPDQGKFDWGYISWVPVILAFLFLGILLSTFLVRRKGRDVVKVGGAVEAAFAESNKVDSKPVSLREMSEMVTLSVVPPEGVEPYEASIILYEQVTNSALQSWFLQQSINGHISIEGKSGGKLQYLSDIEPQKTGPYGRVLGDVFGQNAHETKQHVDLRKDLPTPVYEKRKARKRERGLKGWLPSRGVEVVYVDKSDRSGFIEGWKNLQISFQEWFENSDYWVHNSVSAGKRKWVAITVAIIFGFFAYAALEEPDAGGRIGACIYMFLTGLCLPFITHRWELLVRSPKGSGLWLQIEGFRRFLHTSEQRHVEEASKRGVLRQYTAWAVALGEIEHWKKAILNASSASDSSVSTSEIYFAGSVATMSSASHAPSSCLLYTSPSPRDS